MSAFDWISRLVHGTRTFQGGIHPSYEKHWTESAPSEPMPVPKKLIIPLSQHIGSPCTPLVKAGDLVKKGQKLGQPTGRISVPVHASTSGKVTAVASHPHHSGRIVEAVFLEADGKDEWYEGKVERDDPLALSPEELRQLIADAGISGMGGATFPTHVKLSPPTEKAIKTLILNGAECEPYLTCDHRLMLEQAFDVVEGLKIIQRILQPEEVYIGIEDNKRDAIQALAQYLPTHMNGCRVRIVEVKTKYPEGGEKQLIQAILGQEVPSGGLPMDLGVVCQNVGTTAAIYRAVRYGEPLIERIVTVAGQGIRHPKNVRVRIGTSLKEVIEFCGGFTAEPGKIIVGGPMMGAAIYSLDVPVVKGTIGLLVFPKEQVSFDEMQPCIKCGYCIEVCPAGILPHMLSITAEAAYSTVPPNFEEVAKYHPFDCIECGACDYVCPSKRPIVHLIKHSKTQLSQDRFMKYLVSQGLAFDKKGQSADATSSQASSLPKC